MSRDDGLDWIKFSRGWELAGSYMIAHVSGIEARGDDWDGSANDGSLRS